MAAGWSRCSQAAQKAQNTGKPMPRPPAVAPVPLALALLQCCANRRWMASRVIVPWLKLRQTNQARRAAGHTDPGWFIRQKDEAARHARTSDQAKAAG